MNARAPVENVLQIALEIVKLKGAIHPQNQKFIFLPLPVEPFISLDSFGVSSFGDICRRDYCLS